LAVVRLVAEDCVPPVAPASGGARHAHHSISRYPGRIPAAYAV